MNKPIISPNFTIDDIHKIREWNYERRKAMNKQERIADIEKGASKARTEIERIRREKYSN
ncbi:MAG: hypothetical protein FWG90_06945 [Oscillospiraceae bacterium]|nr:hypothetical protein [Oscillospiraceae bacterium]